MLATARPSCFSSYADGPLDLLVPGLIWTTCRPTILEKAKDTSGVTQDFPRTDSASPSQWIVFWNLYVEFFLQIYCEL